MFLGTTEDINLVLVCRFLDLRENGIVYTFTDYVFSRNLGVLTTVKITLTSDKSRSLDAHYTIRRAGLYQSTREVFHSVVITKMNKCAQIVRPCDSFVIVLTSTLPRNF